MPLETRDGMALRRRLRGVWRGRVRPTWRAVRPVAMLAAAVTVLTLGTVGYMDLPVSAGQKPLGLLDAVYRSFTLFGFGGTIEPPVPLTLQIARVLGPLLTGYAAVRSLVYLSREQFQLMAIRLLAHDHVVIAGLGTSGFQLATSFYDGNRRVVGIEADPLNPNIEACRERGIRVVTGDAVDARTLRKAGVARACYLVVTCGADATSADVATAAGGVVQPGRRVLRVRAHLRDLRLWTLLRGEAMDASNRPEFRLDFFNVWATAARTIVEHHPPFPKALDRNGVEPHVCFVGLEGAGESLVLQVAGMWRNDHPRPQSPLRITLAGPNAERELEALVAGQPEIADVCRLEARTAEIGSAAFQESQVLLEEDGDCTVSQVYVNLANESDALAAALALHGRPETSEVPIVVAVADAGAGVGTMLQPEEGRFAAIAPFGVVSDALNPTAVLRGMGEALAQARHAHYVMRQRLRGRRVHDDPGLVPWSRLSAEARDSYRCWAEEIGADLSETGFGIMPAPLIDAERSLLELTDDEVERLARVDRDRPGADVPRLSHGADGAADDARGWEELSEAERDVERDAARALPRMLAHAGFEMFRRGDRHFHVTEAQRAARLFSILRVNGGAAGNGRAGNGTPARRRRVRRRSHPTAH
jgi:hypothetical protein